MNRLSVATCMLALVVTLRVLAADPPAPKAAAAPPAAAPATTPAAPAAVKPPVSGSAQSAEPDRIDPTEKVRADSEVSFPVDI